MNRLFLSNIFILLITNFVVRPLYIFGIDLPIQNRVGFAEYGLYTLALDFVLLFQFINDPGIQSYTSKSIAENRANYATILGDILGAKMLLAAVYIVLSILGAYLMGYDQRTIALVGGIAIYLVLSSTFVLLRTTLSGVGEFSKDSWVSSLDRVLMLLLFGTVIWLGFFREYFTIEWFVAGQVICLFTSCIVAIYLMLRSKMSLKINMDLSKIYKVLYQTLPFTGLILLTNICNRIDVVMLNELVEDGLFQAGTYAAGYRFLDAANMVGYLFGGLLLPMYAYMISKGEKIRPLFDLGFRLLISLSLIIGFIAIAFAKEIWQIAYINKYDELYTILPPIMLSLVPIAVSHSMGSLLQASGRVKSLNILFAIAVIFNIATNYIIIPQYGATGAAYTTFATEILLISGSYYLVRRYTDAQISLMTFVKVVVIIIVMLAAFVLTTSIGFHWILSIFLLSFIYIMLVFAVKLISIGEIKSLLKKEKRDL